MKPPYSLDTQVWLPAPLGEVFAFFADAHQLESITPAWLRFEVRTPAPIGMHVGTRIDYRLRLHGLPIRWQSEISVWEPPHRFVDRQTRGPYRLWRHEHTFVERDEGTLVNDHVDYRVTCGLLLDPLLVRPELAKIFSYRTARLRQIFGR